MGTDVRPTLSYKNKYWSDYQKAREEEDKDKPEW